MDRSLVDKIEISLEETRRLLPTLIRGLEEGKIS
jgi:hypothetical protein